MNENKTENEKKKKKKEKTETARTLKAQTHGSAARTSSDVMGRALTSARQANAHERTVHPNTND